MVKKTNFEVQLKVKLKKIPETDNQILMHVFKNSLHDFVDKINKFIEYSVLDEVDERNARDLEKQIDFNQLDKVRIEPEVVKRIQQAEQMTYAKETPATQPGITVSTEPRPLVTPKVYTPVVAAPPGIQSPFTPQPAPAVAPPQPESSNITDSKINIPDFGTPSTKPSTPPSVPDISFSIPKLSLKAETTETKASIIDEEDRATGIAILRKKMLMELKKIRSVVAEEEEF
ncbi:MAG: hypothetical protein ACXAEU_25050 [Candidatus Hodarchaeales archaeon]|jgi:hypothetical protein